MDSPADSKTPLPGPRLQPLLLSCERKGAGDQAGDGEPEEDALAASGAGSAENGKVEVHKIRRLYAAGARGSRKGQNCWPFGMGWGSPYAGAVRTQCLRKEDARDWLPGATVAFIRKVYCFGAVKAPHPQVPECLNWGTLYPAGWRATSQTQAGRWGNPCPTELASRRWNQRRKRGR